MLKVNENERILIDKLNKFRDEALRTLGSVKVGIEIAIEFYDIKIPINQKPKIINMVDDLYSLFTKFRIGSEKDISNDGSENIWIHLNDSINYTSDTVTEKNLSFALMSFERDVHKLLALLEQTQKGNYLYLSKDYQIRLQNIIKDYLLS